MQRSITIFHESIKTDATKKAIPNLTIDQTEKQKVELEKKQKKINELEKTEVRLSKMEQELEDNKRILEEILSKHNKKMIDISILGVTDADNDPITITIDGITQDEPTSSLKGKDQFPDGVGIGTDTAQVRAQRDNAGDGRVYEISFTADDGNGGSCSSSVNVSVPLNKKTPAVDSGQSFDSTLAS